MHMPAEQKHTNSGIWKPYGSYCVRGWGAQEDSEMDRTGRSTPHPSLSPNPSSLASIWRIRAGLHGHGYQSVSWQRPRSPLRMPMRRKNTQIIVTATRAAPLCISDVYHRAMHHFALWTAFFDLFEFPLICGTVFLFQRQRQPKLLG